jgi:hypothetical protein
LSADKLVQTAELMEEYMDLVLDFPQYIQINKEITAFIQHRKLTALGAIQGDSPNKNGPHSRVQRF